MPEVSLLEGLSPAEPWRRSVKMGNSTYYKHLDAGLLEQVYIGKRAYVVLESTKKLRESLPRYEPRAAVAAE